MEKLTVLVVDDDREIVESIAIFLQADGYLVRKAYNGLEALDIVMTENVHLIILDIMMPELDGIKTLLKVRESKNLPIILLSAKSEDADKILGLTAGADDYITNLSNMEEVLARIESNLRRIQFQNSTPSSLKCNDLVLDLDGNRAMLQGAELPLTAKEFAILELLMKYPDKIFSKANLFQSVWNTEYISEDNTLNVHISNLRNKMKAICPDKEFIDTVWGIGYRLHKAEG
mgnify:CR=1 FL=1